MIKLVFGVSILFLLLNTLLFLIDFETTILQSFLFQSFVLLAIIIVSNKFMNLSKIEQEFKNFKDYHYKNLSEKYIKSQKTKDNN
jgi:hypothetical protein